MTNTYLSVTLESDFFPETDTVASPNAHEVAASAALVARRRLEIKEYTRILGQYGGCGCERKEIYYDRALEP